jgi:hypothetical protein
MGCSSSTSAKPVEANGTAPEPKAEGNAATPTAAVLPAESPEAEVNPGSENLGEEGKTAEEPRPPVTLPPFDGLPFSLILHYDFKTAEDRNAWVAYFTDLNNDDGIKFTHECCGGPVRLCQLKEKGEDSTTSASTKVTIYEEWPSQEVFMDCFRKRLAAGFFSKWFGFDPSTGKWEKMKDDNINDSHQMILVKSQDKTNEEDETYAIETRHVTIIHYDFKEQYDHDAWLAHFIDDETYDDGFKYTADFAGCLSCKLMKSLEADKENEEKCKRACFYEEWRSAEDQMTYAMSRGKSGFMQTWFDLDMKTFAWNKLKGENARVMHMEVLKALG